MKKLYGILVLPAIALLLCLPMERADAQIYKWVDENGVVSYSNVKPPDDETDVGIIEETIEEQDRSIPSATKDVKSSGEAVASKTDDAGPVDPDVTAKAKAARKSQANPEQPAAQEKELTEEEIAKSQRREYVTQRIERTKRSIAALEKQLRYRPNDKPLKKNLDYKKQTLRKYQKALEKGN
ncbi:MAG: DUF4124 domain-containing protein [Deltaproteobacteria bacterium]|nr:DUF4124 domain-containing protein [Deltaproteobacteria bacterium]